MPFGAFALSATTAAAAAVTIALLAALLLASADAALVRSRDVRAATGIGGGNSSQLQSAADLYDRLMDVEFGAEAAAMRRRPRRSPIFQNEFAVYIPSGDAAADEVAAKYGFSNEGQVSGKRLIRAEVVSESISNGDTSGRRDREEDNVSSLIMYQTFWAPLSCPRPLAITSANCSGGEGGPFRGQYFCIIHSVCGGACIKLISRGVFGPSTKRFISTS